MKKNLALAIILSVITVSVALSQHSCCKMMASNDKSFAEDPAFVKAHLPPTPFVFVPQNGKMITFDAPDGKAANAFVVEGENASTHKIFMFHEWWGLNDYIKQEAERLSSKTGATVIAIDLYDGKVTADPSEASKLFSGLNQERAKAIISGAIDYCGKESQIQTIGWCMGGHWSLQAALMAGPNAKGCVMYYGMPETDLNKLKTLNCAVTGFFAEKDQWITPAVVEKFKSDMKEAGKNIYIYNYNAEHAFANPSNPKFDKVSADDAMQKAVTFIEGNFK